MPPKAAPGSRRLTKENLEEVMSRKSIDVDGGGIPMPQTTHAQMRRQSKWDPKLLPSHDRRLSTVSKTSISGASHTTKHGIPVKHENTYKLEPDVKFQPYRAKDIMMHTLNEYLSDVEYSPSIRTLTTNLTDEIKKRVKALGYWRYKYVVSVTICQDAKQSMQMVSRCMWNKDTDNYAEAVYKCNDVHAIATLYALYYE